MTSFKRLQANTEQMVKRLTDYSGLDLSLVRKIVQYCKCLPKPGTEHVDEPIFTAEMSNTFQISDPYMIARMFSVTKSPKEINATVEEFAQTVCIFLSSNLDVKIDFVFSVYDINVDGEISHMELFQLLKPCVVASEMEDADPEDGVRDIMDIYMTTTNIGRAGSFNVEDYRSAVKKDILLLQSLGPCLPSEMVRDKFQRSLEKRTVGQVRDMFQDQRRKALHDLKPVPVPGIYPFKLDLP